MLEGFLTQTLPGVIQLENISVLTFVIVFLGGILTSISPCILAMIPVMVGYIGGFSERSRSRGFLMSLAFVLGLSVTFALLGIVAASLGKIFGQVGRGWYYIIAIVSLVMGVQLLGIINIRFPTLTRMPITGKGYFSSFLMGLLFGLVASPCATPVLAVIMTYIAMQGNIPAGAGLLFFYGLGHGIPLLLAGTFTVFISSLDKYQQWTKHVSKVSGAVLVLIGLYFLTLARW